MLRLAQRVASVVSWRPARWRAPTARFLRGAMARGPDRVRMVEWSSRERVSDPVQGLGRPLGAGQGGDVLRGGAGGVEAGDAERGDVGQRCAVWGGDVPLDQVGLADVGERQVWWRVEALDGAGFGPAVAAAGGGVGDRGVVPGQGVEGVEQAGLVVFGRQDEVRAA